MQIKRIRVTPMQRVVIKWTAATPAPLKYELVITSKTRAFTKSFEAETNADFLTTQLPAPDEYALEITAVYADEESNQTVQQDFSVDPNEGISPVIRQSIFDILFDAKLTLRGRLVYLFNRDFEPIAFRKSSVSAVATPLIEIGAPMLRRTEIMSEVREREEWSLDIRLLDDGQEENHDTLRDLWLLAKNVKHTINVVDYLNLSRLGVLSKSWEWKIKEDPDSGRDRLTGLVMNLKVIVESVI